MTPTISSLLSRVRAASGPELADLLQLLGEYFSEIDNPAPDYLYRHTLRTRLRTKYAALLSALEQQKEIA